MTKIRTGHYKRGRNRSPSGTPTIGAQLNHIGCFLPCSRVRREPLRWTLGAAVVSSPRDGGALFIARGRGFCLPLNFVVKRPEPGSLTLHDGSKSHHAHNMAETTWKSPSGQLSEKFGDAA